MEKKDYLPMLHKEILNILDEIVRVCESHRLHYYLIGGTLLGAVRHKGFIPWDDDLDIIMPRDDFEKFVNEYYKDLKDGFSLEWINTNPKYNYIFAKVCRDGTLFEEEIGERSTSKRGIFVDIFSMDITNGYSPVVEKQKKEVLKWSGLLFTKFYASEKAGIKKLILNILPGTFLNARATHYMKKSSSPEGQYYSNFGSQYNIKRQTHPISNFGEGVLLSFEDRQYRCPVNFEGVLTSIFGSNYMQLPPEDKRKTHYPVRVVFSDGQEMVFGKTENKVVIGKD